MGQGKTGVGLVGRIKEKKQPRLKESGLKESQWGFWKGRLG